MTSPSLALHDLLACPACHGRLVWSTSEVRCAACTAAYPVVDGIPVLLADQAAAEHDELDHHHGHDHDRGHKQQQADYFGRTAIAEFETRRPHGTPALYRFLLGEKLRRGIRAVRPLSGGIALTVCSGSGMEAEYLARAGAAVIASDISLNAVRRARERARRYNLAIAPLVADVERLPFRDRALDLVFVHDGLHHLQRPLAGLSEMARVAGRAVSVNEPARAGATALAVRIGLALEREEAGNVVARLRPDDVASALCAHGFRVVCSERYAMYYRHEPGPLTAALSRPALMPGVRWAWRAANGVAGRFGNKLTVQALRGGVVSP